MIFSGDGKVVRSSLFSEYKAHISYDPKTQRFLQLAHVSSGLHVFSWDSPKFSNFRLLQWWDQKKIRNVFWTHQIKVKHITRGMPHIDTFQE
jgi:Fe-S-cluster formation regulator IscX/YfhJ